MDKYEATPDYRSEDERIESLVYKLRIVDELSAVMREKFREKEPRRDWREKPMPLDLVLGWILEEVVELTRAAPEDAFREAADVANLAGIYADIKRRAALVDEVRG